MKLSHLVYFITVINEKSFNKAAKKLYISQPTLSLAIQSFEEELGFKLIERTRAGASPTEMGRIVYNDAREIVRSADQAEEKWIKINEERNSLTGTVGLVAFPSAYLAAERIIQSFEKIYPNVRWRLHESRAKNLSEVFEKGQADICIGDYVIPHKDINMKDMEEKGLTSIPLCKDYVEVAVSVSNPLSKKKDLNKEDLKGLSLAYYSGGDDVVDPYFTKYFDEKLAIEYHSFERMTEATANNITVCPIARKLACYGWLFKHEEKRVSFHTVEGYSLEVEHCLIYPKRELFTPAVKCASEYIRNIFMTEVYNADQNL